MIIICLQIIIGLILNIVILNAKASMPVDTLLTHTFLAIFYDVSAAFTINFFEIYMPQFPAQIAYMVVDRLTGIIAVVLVPDNIHNHSIGEYPLGILDQQSEYVKFLCRQFAFLPADQNVSLLQAKYKSPS